ncbi:MAG: GNAT family N-acetyltransferase [Chloroflexia bacterium]|nr:GNAT family N-acetyltransferase [Chloroflexia bacterium]
MDQEYQIAYVEKPEESAWGIIGRGLQEYNIQQTGDSGFERLCYALYAPDESIVGGVIGEVYWGWLHVDLLWVQEDLRGHGYGQRLLALVEEKAREHGAKQAYLDTFSFQAPDFYKTCGYQILGTLEDFPPGQQRYFMTKRL